MRKSDHTIFKDEQLARTFEEQGYLLLDFLPAEAIAQLRKILDQTGLHPERYFYSSSFIEDPALKQQISTDLEAVLQPSVDRICHDYRKLGATFLLKPTGNESIMPIHQDWTIVDESAFDSITIWIPLSDTHEQNGAIKVLPKSHRLTSALRSPTISDPIREIRPLAETLMQPLPMKAGQAFIFSHALLHASFPNISGQTRAAVAFGLVHRDARLLFPYKSPDDDMVEILEVGDDFFLNYPKPGERPAQAVTAERINPDETAVSPEAFRHYYNLQQPGKKRWWKFF